MRTHGSGGAPLPAGAHPAETLSLLGGSRGHSARQGCVAVCVSPSVSDAADSRAAAARPRSRVVALAAGAVFALFALAALASAHDGFRAFGSDAVASLGRGSKSSASAPRAAATSAAGYDDWLLGGADEPSLGAFAEVSGSESSETSSPRRGGSSSRRGGSPSSSSSGGALRNVEGGVPGLVAHVDAATDTTRFRMISFCNQAYWPFAHGMLQSMQFTAPTLVPFWTVIVADEETKAFIEKQAPGVDVFVDVDLQRIVSDADAADGGRAETTRAVTSERDGSADAPRRAGAGAVEEREIPRVVNTREVDNAEATDELVIARVSEEGGERERGGRGERLPCG